jgi:dienelactone hydrolase
MNNYVVHDENIEGKRPAVLVVHEWWGLNDYTKRRAKMLAELGYVAMAVDMYGNGRMANDPAAAQNLAMPYYQHPDMAKKYLTVQWRNLKRILMWIKRRGQVSVTALGRYAAEFCKNGRTVKWHCKFSWKPFRYTY